MRKPQPIAELGCQIRVHLPPTEFPGLANPSGELYGETLKFIWLDLKFW